MQGVTCDGPSFSETGGAGSSRGNRGQLTIFMLQVVTYIYICMYVYTCVPK